MKGISASAAITGLFGITEPAIYGVNLRLKRPMICGCIAGAVGGAVAGAFRAVSWGYNMPGIATLPAYFKAGHMSQFTGLLLSVLIAFVLGIILTYIAGFKEETAEVGMRNAENTELASPVTGNVIPLNKVRDEAFASGALGNGVGIQPEEGRIYAPFDGTATVVFPTGHAVGLTDRRGNEFLIHIGIDTVKLGGKGFTAHISQGDPVKRGDLLVEFDKKKLEKEGYDSTVIYIVTDTDRAVKTGTGRHEALTDTIMSLK